MIEFELGFQYAEEQRAALQQVSGAVAKGRCVVLCGRSGCGKSTLLRCVNGLIPQFYEGERKGFCRLAGQENADLSIGEIGELAASVFQDPRSQFFTVNSSGEVAFGLENHGVPQEKIRRRVDEAFRVFHLEHLQDRNVYELSSGERQLISILAAWAMDTEIFLLDEPTANLDFAATRQLQGLSLRTLDLGKIVVPEAVRAAETEAQSQEAKEPVMLAAEDLRFAYGARGGAKRAGKQTPPLLAGVRFAARRHEVVGLIGANGCGKTTAGKLLAGLYKPSGGAVLLDGRPQTPKKLQEQVMFIMQEAEFQFFTDSVLHELQYGYTVTPTFSERVETLLKSADMWECRQRHPFSLSGGRVEAEFPVRKTADLAAIRDYMERFRTAEAPDREQASEQAQGRAKTTDREPGRETGAEAAQLREQARVCSGCCGRRPRSFRTRSAPSCWCFSRVSSRSGSRCRR